MVAIFTLNGLPDSHEFPSLETASGKGQYTQEMIVTLLVPNLFTKGKTNILLKDGYMLGECPEPMEVESDHTISSPSIFSPLPSISLATGRPHLYYVNFHNVVT
jgi:hypothetical protein